MSPGGCTAGVLVLFISLLTASRPCHGSQSEKTWLRQSNPSIDLFYLQPDRVFVDEISEQLHIAKRDFSQRLHLETHSLVSVFVCPTQAIFDSLTQHSVPHWGAGVAQVRRNIIIIKSPGLSKNRDRLSKLIRHEMAHISCGQLNPLLLQAPKWLIEGLAIYLSTDEAFAGKALSQAFIGNSVIPLDEIDDLLSFGGAKAQLAYEESYAFVSYLIERFGFDEVIGLIHDLDGETEFSLILANRFGVDIFDLEMDWYEQAKKTYRWHFLQDFSTYLWILILLLFMIAFGFIRLRNRKTLKRWEEEERFTP